MNQAGLKDRSFRDKGSKKTSLITASVLPFSTNSLHKPAPISRHDLSASPDAIRAQLSQIFRSSGFVHARRMRQFLEFVIEETLAGRAHQLCEYSIGVSVFERNEFFNPSLDPIVRNDARRLRQKLAEYYVQLNGRKDSEIRIEIPKGHYVPVFSILGAQTQKPAKQYRLSVTLIRIADGAQVWNVEHDLQSDGCQLQLSLNSTPEA